MWTWLLLMAAQLVYHARPHVKPLLVKLAFRVLKWAGYGLCELHDEVESGGWVCVDCYSSRLAKSTQQIVRLQAEQREQA